MTETGAAVGGRPRERETTMLSDDEMAELRAHVAERVESLPTPQQRAAEAARLIEQFASILGPGWEEEAGLITDLARAARKEALGDDNEGPGAA